MFTKEISFSLSGGWFCDGQVIWLDFFPPRQLRMIFFTKSTRLDCLMSITAKYPIKLFVMALCLQTSQTLSRFAMTALNCNFTARLPCQYLLDIFWSRQHGSEHFQCNVEFYLSALRGNSTGLLAGAQLILRICVPTIASWT